jgi:shikimate dehydrogenase
MRIFGLIGYPLGHSFSHRYFTEKFSREGITDCIYRLFPISSIDEFDRLWEDNPDLCGLNVTIPYKEKVIPYLDQTTQVVQRSGACNCIKKTANGLVGHNTDVIGFDRSLRRRLRPDHRSALILGTGGAAKAVAFVLQESGIRYRFVSRNPTDQQLGYDALTREVMDTHTLIVNTTPVGMYPHQDEAPEIPYEMLSGAHYLFDLVYNPEVTRFLQYGKERGAIIENGGDMLQIQAEESWTIWNEDLH